MSDPIQKFQEWFLEAKNHASIKEPTAMALATSTPEGVPSVRVVLLKNADARGFVFYTNLESRKGGELAQNPRAALCFYWPALDKQIRVEGYVEPVNTADADAYFSSRPRDSQLGAWASKQSKPLSSRAQFIAEVSLQAARFLGRDVPRPPHWSGFCLVPEKIEFWKQVEFRMHEREVYTRMPEGLWERVLLYP